MDEELGGEWDLIANCANFSSMIWHEIKRVRGDDSLNWIGFYMKVKDRDELLLGPFMGKTAVTRISFARGVCGACARSREVQLVPDVHAFPDHIACDSASNSELVIPLIDSKGNLVAVLDMDSPKLGGFTQDDADGLSRMLESMKKMSNL